MKLEIIKKDRRNPMGWNYAGPENQLTKFKENYNVLSFNF